MPISLRRITYVIVGIELVIVCAYVLQIGGGAWRFSPLFGALLGGALTLWASLSSPRPKENSEPWVGFEQFAWILIGCAQIVWGVGESFWRYYISINQSPFPSFADLGYSCFPLLCFAGLLLLPSPKADNKRILVMLDSLISMGALFAISWYILLGALAQAPMESGLAKFLGLYYPIADTALVSCVIFLVLRGQGRLYQVTARKVSLLVIGLGLCFFATSDFIFNFQQNAQTYVEGMWFDLGWPLGMLTIGLAAYLRRYLPLTSQQLLKERLSKQMRSLGFGPAQLLPYGLICFLFCVLVLNVVSTDKSQVAIRLVLVLATVGVVVLIIARQILTIIDNERLARLQARSLQQIEDQARQITERNTELESGISHLKAVQTSLANGNLHTRARLQGGVLWSLASSLNLLAERLTSLGQVRRHMELVNNALLDLSAAIEKYRNGQPFVLPSSCQGVLEVVPILHSMGLHKAAQLVTAPRPGPFAKIPKLPEPSSPFVNAPKTPEHLGPFGNIIGSPSPDGSSFIKARKSQYTRNNGNMGGNNPGFPSYFSTPSPSDGKEGS